MDYEEKRIFIRSCRMLQVLCDNELDFDIIFSSMSKHNVPYVAIELLAIDDIDEIYENHKKSVEYLQDNGFILRG